MKNAILTAARSSPLSRVQVAEVQAELALFHPDIELKPYFVETSGDIDKQKSLRGMEKTDFFTKEVDELLLQGTCLAAVHSAKDLPENLPAGLVIAALTKGLDASDALVLRPGETLASLPWGAKVATSSLRREMVVRGLRPDLQVIDLRGTIGERLAKLDSGEADAVVVAEAALIRLGLTHLNRCQLPGETVPGQGKLAIVVREADSFLKELFMCLDSRLPSTLLREKTV